MALVREHGGYGGFDSAEAAAFDALGYGYGHGALLGFDASAALFGEGASAYVSDGGDAWTGAGASTVLAFNRATAAAAAAVVEDEEEESDAWIDAMDQSYGAAAASEAPHALTASVGFDASTGCFTLTEGASSSGGAGRPFGLLFPSASSGGGGTPERTTAPVRAPQKRTYVVRAVPTQFCLFRSGVWTAHVDSPRICNDCVQSAEPQAVSPKKHCGAGRKASKAKSASTTPTKDPQSLAAKVSFVW